MASIVVYGTRPAWGTPDLSPFVIKIETWLRLAGLPYERRTGSPLRSPTGKVPYVEIDGAVMSDSQRIVEALTLRLQVSLDHGLSPVQRATGHAVRRMLEEGLYFSSLRLRWLEEDGWALQVPAFSVMLPAWIAPLAIRMIRRNVRRNAWGQGIGRLDRETVIRMAVADLDALEVLLGDGPYLLGGAPRSVDATVYAFLIAIQRHPGTTPVHEAARRKPFLEYTARIGALAGW